MQVLFAYVGFGADHTLRQLFPAHFQTEKDDPFGRFPGFGSPQGHIFRNVKGQGGFAHGRAGCQYDKIRRMQAADQFVQIGKPGGNAGDGFIAFHHFAETVYQRFHNAFNVNIVRSHIAVGQVEQLLLGGIHYILQFSLAASVTHGGQFCAAVNHFPQQRLFFHNAGVVLDVGRCEFHICQHRNEIDAAYILIFSHLLQFFCNRYHVDRDVTCMQIQHGLIGDLV